MPPKKPASQRQNRATKDTVVELVPGGAAVAPEAPGRWLPGTVAEWDAFWGDDELVSVVRESHRPALVRLFDWRDRLQRAWDQADGLREAIGDEHFTAGSTGQMKANPLYEQAEKAEARALAIEGRVVALEERFGLTPQALLKMGVDFQRRESLAAQNERMAKVLADRSGDASQDPRSLPGDSAVGSA